MTSREAHPQTNRREQPLPEPQVAEGLVEVALRRYTSDNTSVMVVDFRGAEYWEAAGSKKKGFFSFLSG